MSERSRRLPRRSCHAVPGSSDRFLAKAPGLGADMYFLDLEDAVAPSEKEGSRARVVSAIREQDWGDSVLCVRVNSWESRWTYGDIIDVVGQAGERLDEIMIPKVQSAAEVVAADLLLGQVEKVHGLPQGHIGIEAQIETARGLIAVEEICGASPRLETVILGPVDMSASMGMPSMAGGMQIEDYPGDYFHFVFVKILMAGRANGLQVIDGPYTRIRDVEGLRQYTRRSQALGFDGKWSLHPDQVAVLNELFSPTQEQFDKAWDVLEVYRTATDDQGTGAVMFGDEMIDEASRKVAVTRVARGERSGLRRSPG
jgi:citrate lyase subunit beta/citryl-CoA lyase